MPTDNKTHSRPRKLIFPVILFIILAYTFFGFVFRVCVILLQAEKSSQAISLLVFCSLLLVMTLWTYITVLTKDAGVPPTTNQEDALPKHAGVSVAISWDAKPAYCEHCKLYKPDRTHHCRFCNKCILKMDHHCMWIGRCVGQNNHKIFIQLIFWATIYTIFLFASSLCIFVTYRNDIPFDGNIFAIIAISGLFCLLLIPFGFVHLDFLLTNETTLERRAFRISRYQAALQIRAAHGKIWPWERRALARAKESQPLSAGACFTKEGKSVFDLGAWNNWKSVMGTNAIKWILPIKKTDSNVEQMVNEDTFKTWVKELEERR